jgi:hypothetical protein
MDAQESGPTAPTQIQIDSVNSAITNLEKIEAALPQVRGLESGDTELDDLAQMAIDSYKDLSELGMQVDSRYSSEIFNVASTMLGHAITAKTAKLSKKMKMIELQLKKAVIDQKNSDKEEQIDSIPEGEGRLLDRNALLKVLAAKTVDE